MCIDLQVILGCCLLYALAFFVVLGLPVKDHWYPFVVGYQQSWQHSSGSAVPSGTMAASLDALFTGLLQ